MPVPSLPLDGPLSSDGKGIYFPVPVVTGNACLGQYLPRRYAHCNNLACQTVEIGQKGLLTRHY
jgi:hypothetical protein